jgi:hypothetical protein
MQTSATQQCALVPVDRTSLAHDVESAMAPRRGAWWRIQQIDGVATALLSAGLAPALVMAALWHAAKVAPFAFTFTFAIALSHAVFLGLPLFLVSANGVDQRRDLRRLGFAVDDAPAGVLTWPPQHPELHASASVDGAPTIIDGIITAAAWVTTSSLLSILACSGLSADSPSGSL